MEKPSLEHFGRLLSSGVDPAGNPRPSPQLRAPAPPSRGGHPLLPLVILLCALCAAGFATAATTSVRAHRNGRALLSRATEIAAVPLLLAVGGSLAAVPLVARNSSPVHAPAVAAARVAPAPPPARVPAGSVADVAVKNPLLAQLVSLESQMSSDEGRIRSLSAVIDQAPATVTASAPVAPAATGTTAPAGAAPAPAAGPRGPFDEGTDPLGMAHQLALDLEAGQQAEYDLFLSAAQDPVQTAALMAAAASAPTQVQQVIAYNMQAVQAQMAQEAAIEQAARDNVNQQATPKSLLAPLDGPITQPFGPSALVLEPPITFGGVTYPHFHTGVDIGGPLDAPVRAAADGVVALAGAETDGQGHLVGYGNYVVVAHAGKMITLYGHLDQLLVKPGQPVHAGDVIGLEGSSGNSTGPHLHFEVRVAGLLADPAPYFGRQLRSR